MPVLITLSVVIWVSIALNLHNPWTLFPWLTGIGIWAYYFWSDRVDIPPASFEPAAFPFAQFAMVLAAGAVVRLVKITELPLGPYVDEIFTLNNCLDLAHRSFDFFGHTPLISAGWVETANLYLYFNLLILKLFGVSYWSMKLFSVIPGIIACGAVFAIGQLLFNPRVAFATALLFAFAHWPVRLSRYGWDVAFMIMAFSVAIWLLLLAVRRGRPLYVYLAGATGGLGLYSYLGARICLLSLLLSLALEFALGREKWILRHSLAFTIGAAMVTCPLLFYYLANPGAFWVRTAELNVFNLDNPLTTIATNVWRHALMFFTHGGTYARDNFPGLAMMDPLTGLLLVTGFVALLRDRKNFAARLIACTFIVNFAPGIFSISQEGAPYVYRTAAIIVPAFLIVAFGVEWLVCHLEIWLKDRSFAKYLMPAAASVLVCAIVLNLYFYFGLEAKNSAAMRVMAYEARLIGLEIARDGLPVILVGKDTLEQTPATPKPDETFADANPPLLLTPRFALSAIVDFSGRYDQSQTVSNNLARPNNIYFVGTESLESNILTLPQPAKIIFRSRDRPIGNMIRANYPSASLKDIRNVYGEPLFVVAALPKSAAVSAETPAVRERAGQVDATSAKPPREDELSSVAERTVQHGS